MNKDEKKKLIQEGIKARKQEHKEKWDNYSDVPKLDKATVMQMSQKDYNSYLYRRMMHRLRTIVALFPYFTFIMALISVISNCYVNGFKFVPDTPYFPTPFYIGMDFNTSVMSTMHLFISIATVILWDKIWTYFEDMKIVRAEIKNS